MTFNSEEWPKGKLQTVWIWNPGKFPSFCTGVLKIYNFGPIPSVILVDCAVFRTFLDFTKMWTRWNLESIFLKIVHQKGLFEVIKENPNFPSCRGQWLLNNLILLSYKASWTLYFPWYKIYHWSKPRHLSTYKRV